MIHRSENASWTEYSVGQPDSPRPILRAGFSFGAPGDRVAPDGTVWFRAGPRSEMASVQPASAGWFETPTGFGVMGAERVTLATRLPSNLKGKDVSVRRYTVRLHFAEPERSRAEHCVMSVALEGQWVLQDFEPRREGAGPGSAAVQEFKGIEVAGPLDITLVAKSGRTLLSGVEIAAE